MSADKQPQNPSPPPPLPEAGRGERQSCSPSPLRGGGRGEGFDPSSQPGGADERFEQMLGNLLRAGVVLAAAVVLIGGAVYLARHGTEEAGHRVFKGEPAEFRSPSAIVADIRAFRGQAIIQFGLLLLVATPIARVAFSVFAFLRERDWTYVLLTLFVLAVLLGSLFLGKRL